MIRTPAYSKGKPTGNRRTSRTKTRKPTRREREQEKLDKLQRERDATAEQDEIDREMWMVE